MKDANDKTVAAGDVIQIVPGSTDPRAEWSELCFGVITKAASWGVQADIYGINNELYPIRLASNQFVVVGYAAFKRE